MIIIYNLEKLNIDVKDLKDLIELLSWMMLELSRLDVRNSIYMFALNNLKLNNPLIFELNEKEIRESLALANVKSELAEIIFTYSQNSTDQLQKYIENLKLNTLSFNDLEWRVDFKLASRSLRKCVEPEIMLKLDLADSSNKKEIHLLQTDVSNLVNLTLSLEEALNEIKSNYVRRVIRNIV